MNPGGWVGGALPPGFDIAWHASPTITHDLPQCNLFPNSSPTMPHSRLPEPSIARAYWASSPVETRSTWHWGLHGGMQVRWLGAGLQEWRFSVRGMCGAVRQAAADECTRRPRREITANG